MAKMIAFGILFVFAALLTAGIATATTPPPPSTDGCFHNVFYIPAACEGGNITSDTYGGCRLLVCESDDSALTVLACDKPGQDDATHFEMYNQGKTGTDPLTICLNSTCIAGNGFARSADFPICPGNGTPGNETPVCGNQAIESGEQCDDGNTLAGDGCSATCQQEPRETCEIDHRTQTQGGWGQGASGNNPGTYRDANFASAFPAGIVIGDASVLYAQYTSAAAIEALLPHGGPSGQLSGNTTDSSSPGGGALTGQATALTLSVGFDAHDANFSGSDTPLADLVIANSSSLCEGMTVQEVLDEANEVLAGLPSAFSASQIQECAALINENFVDGTADNGNLACPEGAGPGNETPMCGNGIVEGDEACDGSAPQGFTCTQQCTLSPQGNGTGGNGTSVCHDGLFSIPATCEGGEVTTDSVSGGCRTLVCASGGDSMQALACGKPDAGEKTYFEMYRQVHTGPTDFTLCLGETCVGANGFARSDEFPICTDGNGTTPTLPVCGNQAIESGETCDDGNTLAGDGCSATCRIEAPAGNNTGGGNGTVELSVAQWYPQGSNYVFRCVASGFTATSYDWTFGDGQKLLGVSNSDVYHSYEAPGSYDVSCTARDGTTSGSDTLGVDVS